MSGMPAEHDVATDAAVRPFSLSSPAAQDVIRSAEALAPVLGARRADCARHARVPEATIEDFHSAGFFKLLQPGEYGGHEMDPQVFYTVLQDIARTCMSSAWVLGVVGVHNWQLNLFDDEAAAEVWGDDSSVLISSSYAPVGRVTPVDGGFRLSGKWSFSSGCEHCDWVFLGAVVPTEDAPWDMRNYRTFLLPAADYSIVENWDVVGLKGTGSHDIVVDDVFVPEHRTHNGREDRGGLKFMHKAPLYRLPFMQVFSRAVSTPTLGAAQGALEKFVELAKTRQSGPVPMRDDPSAKRLAADVDSALARRRHELLHDFDAMMARARAGESAALKDRARYRHNTATVADECVALSSRMLKAAGSSGIRNHSPLLQQHLDILASQAHVANIADTFAVNHGGMLFGQDSTEFAL